MDSGAFAGELSSIKVTQEADQKLIVNFKELAMQITYLDALLVGSAPPDSTEIRTQV